MTLLDNISKESGHYFNEHYLHSRLSISSIKVKANVLDKLYPCLELLKTIEVVDCIENKI